VLPVIEIPTPIPIYFFLFSPSPTSVKMGEKDSWFFFPPDRGRSDLSTFYRSLREAFFILSLSSCRLGMGALAPFLPGPVFPRTRKDGFPLSNFFYLHESIS